MNKQKFIFAALFFQMICLRNYAQEMNLAEGSFKILITEKTVSLQFTYDSLLVGKYKHEADYVQKKVTEMNNKEPGIFRKGYFVRLKIPVDF